MTEQKKPKWKKWVKWGGLFVLVYLVMSFLILPQFGICTITKHVDIESNDPSESGTFCVGRLINNGRI